MSILFEPVTLGHLAVKNRFVHSATYESMAAEDGEVTGRLVERYRRLAQGEVGLVIPGGLYVHPMGRASRYQAGIHSNGMIAGLRQVVEAVKSSGGRIVFQLMHAGGQARRDVIGATPLAPSRSARDPVNFRRPAAMSEAQIAEAIWAFGEAARRAVEAGADGVQLHAAHGYLINQFLSPFYNHRSDRWGGSEENRFRFLQEVVRETREALPAAMPLLVKLNVHDYTPGEGITPPLAARYAGRLARMGVAGLELSCGTAHSYMNMCRGEVPVAGLLEGVPRWRRTLVKLVLDRLVGEYDLHGPYNLEAARVIRPACGEARLLLVGGLRSLSQMEAVVEGGRADLISMCRPFIREPSLVRRLRRGHTDLAACTSCNRCFAAMVNDKPVRCYDGGCGSDL
jgi:2,4-dienoyl-CoA reductase-like NADH-dependent reductase (Old Yellow Enzyme family)